MNFNPRWFGLCITSAALLWTGVLLAIVGLFPFALLAGVGGFYVGKLAYEEDLK